MSQGFDMARFRRLADTFITRNGRTVSLITRSTAVTDINKPWRGNTAGDLSELEVTMSFIGISQQYDPGLGKNIQTVEKAYVSAEDITEEQLRNIDYIRDDDGTIWYIDGKISYKPASLPIAYSFSLRT